MGRVGPAAGCQPESAWVARPGSGEGPSYVFPDHVFKFHIIMKLEDMIRVELRSLRPGSPAAPVGPGSGPSQAPSPQGRVGCPDGHDDHWHASPSGRYRDRGTVAPGLGRTAIGPGRART
jgi:hypothetical protein